MPTFLKFYFDFVCVCVCVQLCMKYTYLHNFIIEQAVVNSPKMK